MVVVRSGPFAFGLILSPPLALIAKNEELESPLILPFRGLILSPSLVKEI
jgi:hypothetical protein